VVGSPHVRHHHHPRPPEPARRAGLGAVGTHAGQGSWTEAAYLALNTRRLVEFDDGCLEVLPMPDVVHQLIVWVLTSVLNELSVDGQNGLAVPSPFKLKIPNGRWREPDVSYLMPRSLGRYRREWWDYADLTVEVVSPDDPNRDYVLKRADYALAGVPEYWIIDPGAETITVLVLEGGAYRQAQRAGRGDVAQSVLLPGFRVDVTELLAKSRRFEPGNP
jgi:Uma2 family endonuclease